MHIHPQALHSKNPQFYIPTEIRTKHQSHRYGQGTGYNSSRLLFLPSESLTHVTSFLDAASLFALARTNSRLNDHVNDDNTWHRAFNCQFLGVNPETDVDVDRSLLLKRTQTSWKYEFVLRCNLLKRWERSRNPTVTHTPHYSPVASMHLMSDRANGPQLITSSLQYGIVSRSQPLTGKILKGFLDASGTVNGLGIGNPNAEFSPNVSACALGSDGGTAKILWGYSNGEVAITNAARAMDAGRTFARLSRCCVDEQHNATVTDVIWTEGEMACVTGSTDGIVKLWEPKRLRCVWTSNKLDALDSCMKVSAVIKHGVVVSVMRTGDVIVWSGLTDLLTEESRPLAGAADVDTTRIPYPSPTEVGRLHSPKVPLAIMMDPHSTPSRVSFAIRYEGDFSVHRINVDITTHTWERVLLTGGSLGPVTSIFASFPESEGGSATILVGDQLGRVCLYDWSSKPSSAPDGTLAISPSFKFDAHDDGAITALSCGSLVLVTGSSRGTVKVWDVLTFRLLKSFPSPAARPAVGAEWDAASHVLVEQDLLVVSVGSRVMAWRAGPIHNPKTLKMKHAGKGKKGVGLAKWHQQLEMRRDITESRRLIEDEHTDSQRTYTREREQLGALHHLGLDEVEALEYVLMLSRDEEEANRLTVSNRETSVSPDEGVFEDDFQDVPSAHAHRGRMSNSSSPPAQTPIPSPTSTWTGYTNPSELIRFTPSALASRIQVSPRFRPEPMEAGRSFTDSGSSSPGSWSMSRSQSKLPSPAALDDAEQFPDISSSASSSKRSSPASPQTSRAVGWSAILKSNSVDASSSSSAAQARLLPFRDTTPPPGARSLAANTSSSLLSDRLRRPSSPEMALTPAAEDCEGDVALKFTLELSLAEALSAGL